MPSTALTGRLQLAPSRRTAAFACSTRTLSTFTIASTSVRRSWFRSRSSQGQARAGLVSRPLALCLLPRAPHLTCGGQRAGWGRAPRTLFAKPVGLTSKANESLPCLADVDRAGPNGGIPTREARQHRNPAAFQI